MESPQLVLLFSGKRKSGKDYICERLKSKLGEENCVIIRISGPLKWLYSEHHNLDWTELMSDGPYKEKYRLDMIKWSDEVRNKDPGFFCRAACEKASPKSIWIISDIRRKTDIKWFKENYTNLKTVRITAGAEIRKNRGWVFTKGVDDATSECDLDDIKEWDIKLENNSTKEGDEAIENIFNCTKKL